MAQLATVVTTNGVTGQFVAEQLNDAFVCITLDNGRQFWVPPAMLVPLGEDRYELPLAIDRSATQRAESVVLPVIEEEVVVDKRQVDTGGVRLTKHVSERQERVEVPLRVEELDIQRVPANELVETPEPARQEGDTTIIPIYEEVVVVEKRLRLRERWIITRRARTETHSESVSLRSEEAAVERIEPQEPRPG